MSETSTMAASKDFQSWWDVQGESVEPANLRRNGESGVERIADPQGHVLYIKRQRNHLYYSLQHPLGEPTIMREVRAIAAMNKLGITTPQIVFSECRKEAKGWRAVLVTRELTGYTDLDRWYAESGRERLGRAQHERFLEKLGQTLSLMHRHRWQHTALYPKHIFVTPGDPQTLPEIALIDLEKARITFSARRAARRDLDQLKRRGSMWSDAEWALLLKGHQQGKL